MATVMTACGTGGDWSADYKADMKNPANTLVNIHTNYGDIVAEIYTEEVPTIGGSFVTLAEEGKYDGTIFHRVIDGFMIQGGDYENRNGTGGQAANGGMLDDEIVDGLSNVRGTFSMANRGVVGGKGTNGSQFFINQNPAGNAGLDGKHSVFGMVLSDMAVVDTIAAVETSAGDKPKVDVVIDSIDVMRAAAE